MRMKLKFVRSEEGKAEEDKWKEEKTAEAIN
jgi:hypothetical protein